MPAFVFRRPVRFEEVDAAGLVYFPKVMALAHEALERLLADAMPGGYASFVVTKRVGLPCVHFEADFKGSLRFGDDVEVSMRTAKTGTSSVTFEVEVRRGDGRSAATLTYVVACAELEGPKKMALPDELREIFARFA